MYMDTRNATETWQITWPDPLAEHTKSFQMDPKCDHASIQFY